MLFQKTSEMTNAVWLYASRGTFKWRGWVLFHFVSFNGVRSPLSQTHQNGYFSHSPILELDSMTQEPGNIRTLIPPWNSSHSPFWGDGFRRAIRWLCLENHSSEFCWLFSFCEHQLRSAFYFLWPSHTPSSHFSAEGGAVVSTQVSKNESQGCSNCETLLRSFWKVSLEPCA